MNPMSVSNGGPRYAPHVWIPSLQPRFPENSGAFKQTHNRRQSWLLSLLQRQRGQPVEDWEPGLEFNYRPKALWVQYEREGWGINLGGRLCLHGGYKEKTHSKQTMKTLQHAGLWLRILTDGLAGWQSDWLTHWLICSLQLSFINSICIFSTSSKVQYNRMFEFECTFLTI